ncbi:MAG: phosphoribosyltransferase [bacterium]
MKALETKLAELVIFDDSHQREEVSLMTYSVEELYVRMKDGWTFKRHPEGFILRAPEEWFVDLSDPYKVIYHAKIEENLAYFLFIRDLIKDNNFENYLHTILKKYHIGNFSFILLKGPSLKTEVRLAGSDKRISLLKDYSFFEFEQNNLFNCYVEKANKILRKDFKFKSKRVSIYDQPVAIRDFFFSLKDQFSPLNNFQKDTFNNVFFEDLFKGVPEADVYLFIPYGCFRYISSFVVAHKTSKIMLWELHTDKHYSQTSKYMAKNLKGKNVLIIDNSYTGKTLTMMADLVKKEGGNPIRLALFPKSELSIRNSEYVLFVNKFFSSKDINLVEDDWFLEMYKNL